MFLFFFLFLCKQIFADEHSVNASFEYVVDMNIGFQHTCVLTNLNNVSCVGYDDYLEINNDFTPSDTLVAQPIQGEFRRLFAGSAYSEIVQFQNGTITSWGNSMGQPLSFKTYPFSEPVVTSFMTMERHCLLFEAGNIKCSGYNHYGELGVPNHPATSNDVYVDNPNVTDAFILAQMEYTTYVAALRSGGLISWGKSELLGRTTTSSFFGYVQGFESDNVTDMECAPRFCMVVDSIGRVFMWGRKLYYEFGDGAPGDNVDGAIETIPVHATLFNETVVKVAAMTRLACAYEITGNVRCVGAVIQAPIIFTVPTFMDIPPSHNGKFLKMVTSNDDIGRMCVLFSDYNPICWGYSAGWGDFEFSEGYSLCSFYQI